MSHITERPQSDGTTEYDVIWRDAHTGRQKKYEAENKADALRFKRTMDAQASPGCHNGHHAVCQNRRIYQKDQHALTCECRCHVVEIVICANCGAEVEWEQTNEHTRTHK